MFLNPNNDKVFNTESVRKMKHIYPGLEPHREVGGGPLFEQEALVTGCKISVNSFFPVRSLTHTFVLYLFCIPIGYLWIEHLPMLWSFQSSLHCMNLQ